MSAQKRIAVVGTGIAGNGAAWALAVGSRHRLAVYEADGRAGGHAATVDVAYDDAPITVDTGFIVYNEPNYPNFTRLLAHLGIGTQASDMSFSVSDWEDNGGARLTWTSRPSRLLGGLVPNGIGIPSPVHLLVLRDLVRFNRSGVADLHAGRLEGLSLGDYLASRRFSRRFREDYVVAMGSAIWSMPPGDILDFPAASFLSFFENHRLLRIERPTWRTLTGGSRNYVAAMTAPFADRLRLDDPVLAVRRDEAGVEIVTARGSERYDAVVLACHSDQALALLESPTAAERAVLGAIRYRENDVYLHRDSGLMPRDVRAWAAWNVIKHSEDEVCVTYHMNALQGIDPARPLFVSLEPPRPPAPGSVFRTFSYAHPQFDQAAIAAQARLPEIQGGGGVHFAGAWTKYGFHEDGLVSGLLAAEALGATIPWRIDPRSFAEAAE